MPRRNASARWKVSIFRVLCVRVPSSWHRGNARLDIPSKSDSPFTHVNPPRLAKGAAAHVDRAVDNRVHGFHALGALRPVGSATRRGLNTIRPFRVPSRRARSRFSARPRARRIFSYVYVTYSIVSTSKLYVIRWKEHRVRCCAEHERNSTRHSLKNLLSVRSSSSAGY